MSLNYHRHFSRVRDQLESTRPQPSATRWLQAPALALSLCTLTVAAALVGACDTDEVKRIKGASGGEGEEAQGGSSLGSEAGSNPSGAGSVGGNGTSGPAQGQGGTGGDAAGAKGGTPAVASGGAPDAAGGEHAAGGEPAAGGAPNIPISSCGAGMFHAGEGMCAACPATPEVVQIACADYDNAAVSTDLNGLLLAVRLHPNVLIREPAAVGLNVAFVNPNASLLSEAVFNPNNGSWFVSLVGAPPLPDQLVVPAFTATGTCGDTYQSTEPVSFSRGEAGSTYLKDPCL